jgi:uncharacterized protein (DUF2336 family)
MIVRQFLHWIRTAPAAQRAEATAALARAYLYSDLSPDDRAAAEGAMIMSLDDGSPLVRRALAEGLADSPDAPPAVIHGLAADQPEIAAVVLEHSVLFIDADLIETIATGVPAVQTAIARRTSLPRAVAAAIAEVGSAEACLTLIENPDAGVAPFSIDRIAERHGTLAAIRDTLLARPDLPAATRQALIVKLSTALADFVTARRWLDGDRAQRVVKEACEKATVTIAAERPDEASALVRHLRASGQLTVGLMLRSLLSGNVSLFEGALAELSDVPLVRVRAIVHDRGPSSFRALYAKAQLPDSVYPAFREAVAVLREVETFAEVGGSVRLKRRMVERVLAGCELSDVGEIEPLLMLLRRFATEAAREEARLYCDGLVAFDEAETQRALAGETAFANAEPGYERLPMQHDAPALVEASEVQPELRYAFGSDGRLDVSYGYLGHAEDPHAGELRAYDPYASFGDEYGEPHGGDAEPYYEYLPSDYLRVNPALDRFAA